MADNRHGEERQTDAADEALARECEELRQQLTQLVAERDRLVYVAGPNLDAEYQVKLGTKQFELFSLTYGLCRMKRKMELIQLHRNRLEDNSVHEREVEEIVDKELASRQRQVNAFYEKLVLARRRCHAQMKPEDEARMQTVYRKLVGRIHPDLYPASNKGMNGLWARVKEAYQHSDINELTTLAQLVSERTREEETHYTAEARDALRQDAAFLQKSVEKVTTQIQELQGKYPYVFAAQLADTA